MGSARRPIALATLLGALAIGALAVLAPQPDLRFVAEPGVAIAFTNANTNLDEPLSVGNILVCLAGPAQASIVGVTFGEPLGDVPVDAFAIRANPFAQGRPALGGERTTLAAYGEGFDPTQPQTVSGSCPRELGGDATDDAATRLFELAVQLRLHSGEVGGGRQLRVRYVVGWQERTLNVPFAIWLCARSCPANLISGT